LTENAPKAAKLDAVAARERVADRVEDRVHDVLDVALIQMRVLLGDFRSPVRT
jgi:hypothetical protein